MVAQAAMIAPNSSVTAPMTTASWAVGARLQRVTAQSNTSGGHHGGGVDRAAIPGWGPPSRVARKPGLQRNLRGLGAPQQHQQPDRGQHCDLRRVRRQLRRHTTGVPKVLNVKNIPTIGRVPSPVHANAFLAAVAADGLWYQKPINRYDARPYAQPTYSNT